MTHALVRRSTAQSISRSTWTTVNWNVETADPGNFYDSAAPTRLTIPSGVSRVALSGLVSFGIGAVSASFLAAWAKNGVRQYPGSAFYAQQQINSGFGNNHCPCFSGIIPVVPGDYFELQGWTNTGLSAVLSFDGAGNRVWGSIRDMTGVPACTVYRDSTQSPIASTWSTGDTVDFTSTLFDDLGAFDLANPDRLTVPVGASLVRLTAQVRFPDDASSAWYALLIRKNGVAAHTDRARTMFNRNVNDSVGTMVAVSAPLAVSPGDYFDVFVVGNDSDHNAALADLTWFTMEVLQTT